jgi:hypothetical protein
MYYNVQQYKYKEYCLYCCVCIYWAIYGLLVAEHVIFMSSIQICQMSRDDNFFTSISFISIGNKEMYRGMRKDISSHLSFYHWTHQENYQRTRAVCLRNFFLWMCCGLCLVEFQPPDHWPVLYLDCVSGVKIRFMSYSQSHPQLAADGNAGTWRSSRFWKYSNDLITFQRFSFSTRLCYSIIKPN